MAGIAPGVLVGIALMFVNYRISKRRNYEKRTEAYSWKEILDIIRKSLTVLLMPIIIVGGILSGVYTATESAAVAAAYAFIISLIFFRQLKLVQLPNLIMN